jgi:quercetin dioxygenase-like cupin family protein
MSLVSHPIAAPAGTLFTFEKAGDSLPMHRHTKADVHVTCVMRGRFRIHGPEIGDKEYEAGAFIDWNVDVDHEIVALTDNARVANFLKYR